MLAQHNAHSLANFWPTSKWFQTWMSWEFSSQNSAAFRILVRPVLLRNCFTMLHCWPVLLVQISDESGWWNLDQQTRPMQHISPCCFLPRASSSWFDAPEHCTRGQSKVVVLKFWYFLNMQILEAAFGKYVQHGGISYIMLYPWSFDCKHIAKWYRIPTLQTFTPSATFWSLLQTMGIAKSLLWLTSRGGEHLTPHAQQSAFCYQSFTRCSSLTRKPLKLYNNRLGTIFAGSGNCACQQRFLAQMSPHHLAA